jgi:UDP-N-acetylmuramate--alanine ligase
VGIKSLMLSRPGMATEPVPAVRLGRVHFTGIGGAGMSGIARIMLARGIGVSGSDSMPSALLDDLHAHGARVYVGHEAGHLGDLGPGDTLVLSSAIRAGNPELAEATRRGMRILHRAAALASVMAGRRVIAVAGTHGKTTTTSMLTTVLRECGADPGYVIGGILTETGLGAEDGAGMDFVAEADESDGSFLLLSPDVAVITNVEADHLDNYASLAEIEAAFAAFAGRVGGMVLTCADDPGAEAVAARLDPARVRRYGESMQADYRLSDIKTQGMTISFAVTADRSPFGELLAQMTVQVPGRHNALNATAAFAAAVELGFAPPRVTAALAGYRGARRRMELKGEVDGVRVLDSYAHHPTELAADLRAARDIVAEGSGGRGGVVPPGASTAGGSAEGVRGERLPAQGGSGGMGPPREKKKSRGGLGGIVPPEGNTASGRVIAIFQPHLYSRTRIFAADFGAALGLADEVVVLDVYAAREDPEPGVTGQLVADAVPGGRARFLPDRTQIAPVIARIAQPGDVVLTMGAGDVTVLGPQLVEALRRRLG